MNECPLLSSLAAIDAKTGAPVAITVLRDPHTTKQTVTVIVRGRIVVRIETDAIEMHELFKEEVE